MRRPLRLLFAAAAVLVLVPGWTGETRLPLLGDAATLTATPVALDPADPARRRVGDLVLVAGWRLASDDRAFGGFSALAVRDGRVTMVSDGGNLVRFSISDDGSVRGATFGRLATGPGTGWEKRDRDAEAMAEAPDGTRWIGFESRPSIFRYAADGRMTGAVRPRAMRRWSVNGGIESLARLPDGRFVAIAEQSRRGEGRARPGLIFAGDPITAPAPAAFRYLPPPGSSPSDAAALPDGGLLVVNRRFRLPFRFSAELTLVPAGAIRAGATVTGRSLAVLDAPLVHDNFEGVAVTRQGGDTIIWLVSDDNESVLQRTLLLKFRLDTREARRP